MLGNTSVHVHNHLLQVDYSEWLIKILYRYITIVFHYIPQMHWCNYTRHYTSYLFAKNEAMSTSCRCPHKHAVLKGRLYLDIISYPGPDSLLPFTRYAGRKGSGTTSQRFWTPLEDRGGHQRWPSTHLPLPVALFSSIIISGWGGAKTIM